MAIDRFELGVCSVSFRKESIEDIIDAVQKARLSAIEWGSDVHVPAGDRKKIETAVTMMENAGIRCSSYGTYFRLGETDLRELPRYIETASALGTDILRLWCGTKSGIEMSGSEREALLSECEKAAEIAEKYDVTLSMECHKKTFTERAEDAVRLMEAVGSPHFRMYWQPFQWLGEAENCRNAKAVSPYTTNIHVFNWKEEEKLPLREAEHTWQKYLNCFSGRHTLLLEFMPDGRLETLAEEAAALRRIAGGIG